MAAPQRDRVQLENVNHPGQLTSVDGPRYRAMRDALLEILPDAAPGLTEAQVRSQVQPKLPADLYPGGDKAAWWAKAVQLDLEAKGEIVRQLSRPLRWQRPTQGRRPVAGRAARTFGDRPHRWGGDRTP
ncbi:MAG TPA: hypothetical protein VET90_03110 [Candidatus Binatus sp.]|nr:hypothetical protein [Candidatus Binatus sp.]